MASDLPEVSDVISHLDDVKQPVSVRMRAIFGLKGLGTSECIRALERSLTKDPSALVRHEVAYVLGQMGATEALKTLQKVLADEREDVMVRHEAAEAMGAIGDHSSILALQRYSKGDSVAREISETCALALQRIKWNGSKDAQVYSTVDPAPPANESDVSRLHDLLCDLGKDMFERYRAMFALRNIGGHDAVLALCRGMENEEQSALFRHEVAYVLGQMQHSAAVPTLVKFLKKADEHEMVRHEAAEALGSIGGDEVAKVLEEFRKDERRVVRESVEVALDISEYVSGTALHYADTLGHS